MADFRSYVESQDAVGRLWRDPRAWSRAALLTVARMGPFSSDRSIHEYAERVWNVKPEPIVLETGSATVRAAAS
jgi:starch phosphorylase